VDRVRHERRHGPGKSSGYSAADYIADRVITIGSGLAMSNGVAVCDVGVMPDDLLFVSDDIVNAISCITYNG
jgi:hypothetical protein